MNYEYPLNRNRLRIEQEELLLKPLRARVLAGVMPRFAERLHIERAVLGNNAGMIGAALLVEK